jgi:hypothetical protein
LKQNWVGARSKPGKVVYRRPSSGTRRITGGLNGPAVVRTEITTVRNMEVRWALYESANHRRRWDGRHGIT